MDLCAGHVRRTGDLTMPALYVMCGVPGSGKTTRSKQMAKELGLIRFSFDEMRCFRLAEFMRPAVEAMQDGKSVILDSTNLRVNVRAKILQAVADIPCKKVVVYMNTPLEECILRNANRACRLQDFVIESAHRSLQPPTLDEGWDEVEEVKP